MLIDIYALSPERSAAAVERFLNRFLPHRERTAVDYPVPAYSDSASVVFRAVCGWV